MFLPRKRLPNGNDAIPLFAGFSLDPTMGSEIKKTRSPLVLSPNEMNHYLHTIIIAPLTLT